MKKTRFSEVQIMGVRRQMEGGAPSAELCRENGMSRATLYKWRAKSATPQRLDSIRHKLNYSLLLLIGLGFVISQPIGHGWWPTAKG